ncbi:MAG: methyl-accepting chemotaxis protein [Candidatus Ozemobacteraceae bacterium]
MNTFLNRLTILQKLLLLAGAFLLPIITLVYHVTSALNRSIESTHMERIGVALQKPAAGIMFHLPRYIAGLQLSSRESSVEQATITQSMRNLSDIVLPNAEALKLTNRHLVGPSLENLQIAILDRLWQEARLRELAPGQPLALTDQHIVKAFDLMERLRDLIIHVGDTSRLILDPDLDSFYLMDLTTIALPRSHRRLSEMLRIAIACRRRGGKSTSAERIAFLLATSNLQDDLVRIKANSEKAIHENALTSEPSPSLRDDMPKAILGLSESFRSLFEIARIHVENQRLSREAEKDVLPVVGQGEVLDARFENCILAAVETAEKTWTTAAGELTLALEKRDRALCRERFLALLSTAAALLFSCLLVGAIIRSIVVPLREGEAAARRLAEGDFTVELKIDRTDEIGTLFTAVEAMRHGLGDLVRQVQTAAVQVAATAGQIAAASSHQETIVSDFSSSTTESAAAVKEITATALELSQTMQEVKESSGRTRQLAGEGTKELASVEETMRDLSEATTGISGKLALIQSNADAINAVVVTMTRVADQTNLLSLNASIEAEKAGTWGRGFSVVAREIRRLADQTAASALDIERMIVEMRTSVEGGMAAMEQLTARVERGVHASNELGRHFIAIVDDLQLLMPRFEGVTDGMQAQAAGARQISQAMSNLNDGARQAVSSLKQFNAATTHLREASRTLHTEVSRFRV